MFAGGDRGASERAEGRQLKAVMHQLFKHHVHDIGHDVLGPRSRFSHGAEPVSPSRIERTDVEERPQLGQMHVLGAGGVVARQPVGGHAAHSQRLSDMLHDTFGHLDQGREITQALEQLQVQQQGQPCGRAGSDVPDALQLHRSRRVDILELFGGGIGLEARVGGFVQRRHAQV